jgi:hypothetical protein
VPIFPALSQLVIMGRERLARISSPEGGGESSLPSQPAGEEEGQIEQMKKPPGTFPAAWNRQTGPASRGSAHFRVPFWFRAPLAKPLAKQTPFLAHGR